MKNNLGKILFIFLVFFQFKLIASTYEWSSYSSKTTAMRNEAIYLKYSCTFSDRAELYNIEFNPMVENENYSIELLSESRKIVDGKKVNIFEFVVFVKKVGDITFAFDAVMKKTNEDSIQNTVLGRDNADYEEFTQTRVDLEPINVMIKDPKSEIIGDFSLKNIKDIQKTKAFKSYNFEVIINGIGNFKDIKPIIFELDGVKVFSQKVKKNINLTKDGYSGTWSQKFAFVGKKDFTIPKVKIKYYDLKAKKLMLLEADELKIQVQKAYEKKDLLDDYEEDFEIGYGFVFYILTFIAGYLFAKSEFKILKEVKKKDTSFQRKIKDAKSLDALGVVLALKNPKKYAEIIIKIEMKKFKSLKEAKKFTLEIDGV